MRTLSRWIGAALAAAVMLTVAAPFAGAQEKQEKKLKDGERELYGPPHRRLGHRTGRRRYRHLRHGNKNSPSPSLKTIGIFIFCKATW